MDGSIGKHCILLASEDWCKQASAGLIKAYDFRKKRKMGIKALGPGSVCDVFTLRSEIVYGEFTVKDVKLVSARGYQELALKGLLREPL